MNKQITILEANQDKKLIIWDEDPKASYYELVGMDGLFNLYPIKKIKDNKIIIDSKDLKKYTKLCIKYIFFDKKTTKEFVLNTTDYFELNQKYKEIIIKAIESYKGITFSFYSEEIYDKYCVYEKTNNGDFLLVETEDFQVNSLDFKIGNEYYVEAYSKNNDSYLLTARSNIFTCTIEKIKKPSNTFLSIIVPVYNGELFLARTIDSLLLSSFKDFEIIIVNDGSTDNTKDVVEWYKKKYKGIFKVYHQESQGPSFTRNKGIEHITGEYAAFFDSDDMAHPYMYEQLVNFGKEKDLDVVISKVITRSNINEYKYILNPTKDLDKDNITYTFEEMIREKEKNTINNIFFVSACNKIVKAKYIKNHPFPKLNRYEDSAYTMALYSYLNSFGFCKKAYYMWDKRFRSTIGTYSSTYSNISATTLNVYYVTACFNACKEGNKDRINYLSYYSTNEIFSFLSRTKTNLFANSYAWSYVQEIKELNKRIDLLKNPYITHKKELLSFVEKALNYKSV